MSQRHVDLRAIGYEFTPAEAREWAERMRQKPKKWAKWWALIISERCADLGISCPPRPFVWRAILKHMEEA